MACPALPPSISARTPPASAGSSIRPPLTIPSLVHNCRPRCLRGDECIRGGGRVRPAQRAAARGRTPPWVRFGHSGLCHPLGHGGQFADVHCLRLGGNDHFRSRRPRPQSLSQRSDEPHPGPRRAQAPLAARTRRSSRMSSSPPPFLPMAALPRMARLRTSHRKTRCSGPRARPASRTASSPLPIPVTRALAGPPRAPSRSLRTLPHFTENPNVTSSLTQTFTIPVGAAALHFTVNTNLMSNGSLFPPDAFEAALLDPSSSTRWSEQPPG